MPTRNPRVNVTLRPEQYELISRLSKVQGRSRSAVLVELFSIVMPVLERVVVVSEAAQRVQVQAREGLKQSVEASEALLLPHVASAMGQLDLLVENAIEAQRGSFHPFASTRAERERSEPRRERALRRQGPRPVIRGPGRGAKAPAGGATKRGRR